MAEAALIPKIDPKRTAYLAEGVGALFRIALVIFIIAAAATGSLYLYKVYLSNNLANQKALLEKLKVEFEPSLIADLERISNSVASAREILRNHLHPSKVFKLLEDNTLSTVSFSSFAYSADKRSLTLAGEAQGYSHVTAQSEIFSALPEVESVAFSNLALKDTGTVNFALNIILKP